jgi:hypothetical protein
LAKIRGKIDKAFFSQTEKGGRHQQIENRKWSVAGDAATRRRLASHNYSFAFCDLIRVVLLKWKHTGIE